jgi:protein-tyrosine-phosphatase
MTLQILREDYGIDASSARSKPWNQFKDQHFDFIITVCDEAKEATPVWLGQPIVAHWHSPDPLRFTGTPEQMRTSLFQNLTYKLRVVLQLRLKILIVYPTTGIRSPVIESTPPSTVTLMSSLFDTR